MKAAILWGFTFLLSGFSLAQDCYDCGKRSVRVFDFLIKQFPAPSADHDSILNFYNALKITPAVFDWLEKNDAGRECLTAEGNPVARLLDSTRALNDPGILQLIADIPYKEPPQMSEAPDYYITGNIFPVVYNEEKYLMVELQLNSGPNDNEIGFGLSKLDYYPVGDPQKSVADAVAHKMGSIFNRIREFEVEKRNSGAPYAINPTLIGVPAKRSLELNESTLITFYLKDCDGEPLPNRTINLPQVFGGTLDQNSITTNSNGEGVVQFTANSTTPMVGGVIPAFSYTKPSGKEGDMNILPVYIDIQKPSDTWSVYISLSFQERRSSGSNSNAFGIVENRSSADLINEYLYTGAWVKAYPVPLTGYLVLEKYPVTGSIQGTRSETGAYNSFWANAAGNEDIVRTTSIDAITNSSSVMEFDISIAPDYFNIGVRTMAGQTGSITEVRNTWDLISGQKHEELITEADPEVELGTNVYNPPLDTSYSYSEVTNPNEYTTETVYQKISQRCSWNPDNRFLLSYDDYYTLTQDVNWPGSGVSNDRLEQSLKLIVELSYNELSESEAELPGIYDYSMSQNYPNPFNPSTKIDFSIAREEMVNISVFNLLGEKIQTLINEVKKPGSYSLEFNAAELPTGIYFYKITAGEYSNSRKMLLLK